MDCLKVGCPDLSKGACEFVHHFATFLENIRENIHHLFNLIFSHRSCIHQGSQLGCEGFISRDRVQQICHTLNTARIQGVFFNTHAIESRIEGGTCSAMALDFIDQYLRIRAQSSASPFQTIKKISKYYQRSSPNFMLNQAAFNTVERNFEEYTADFKRDKIAAMLKLFSRNVGFCSDEVDLSSQLSAKKISQIMTNLPQGIFLVRTLLPAQNRKGEMHGHSTVLVKEGRGLFFYDPNHGTIQLAKRHAASITHEFLQTVHRQFNTPNVRFYKVY